MDRRYGERRDTLCRFLSPDPLSFLIGLLNSQPELPQRPGLLTGSNAACIFLTSRFSHGHKRGRHFPRNPVFSRAQARSVFPPQPGRLAGTSPVSISTRNPAFSRAQARSVFPPATRLSRGHKPGQYFHPQPGFLAGTSAVSAASACERTALRNAKQQGAIATQSNGVERSPSGD